MNSNGHTIDLDKNVSYNFSISIKTFILLIIVQLRTPFTMRIPHNVVLLCTGIHPIVNDS